MFVIYFLNLHHYAHNQLESGVIDYFQGLFGGPFYRNNPENLALEHTAYTNIDKLIFNKL